MPRKMPSRLGSLSCHCAIGQHTGCEVSQMGVKKNQPFEPRKIHILLEISTIEGNATIQQNKFSLILSKKFLKLA